jgi:hypothetical protein
MGLPRPFKRSHRRKCGPALAAALMVAVVTAVALTVPACARATPNAISANAQTTARQRALAQSVANVPTLSGQDSADMAHLPVIPADMSCAQLAKTTQVSGRAIQIVNYQTASASASSPKYCAVTGHINTYIGFEILLPISTWRQRYLQVGCGGLCGSISISPAETTGYQPLAGGDFVLAAEDDGHSGNSISWSSNAEQRVDFAYLSYHDVALVSKGLAAKFYGSAPRYSYFDGCSQGGNEALDEVQRYPTDFNGVLAGAPASITTELNSVLHEYTFEANYSEPGYSGTTVLDQPESDILLNAAMKACDPKTGLMLDDRACEQKFNFNLQPFEQAGGKLILWQGEADYSIPVASSIAYYQALVKAMGGLSATRHFARYYVLPGVGHCGGNGPDTYNGLGAVVAWSEKHIAPQALVATQYAPAAPSGPPGPPPAPGATDLTDVIPALGAPAATAVVRQITEYPYPELPSYKGHGNVDDASSYVGKVSRALEQPIHWLGKFDSAKIWCNSQGLDCTETNQRT